VVAERLVHSYFRFNFILFIVQNEPSSSTIKIRLITSFCIVDIDLEWWFRLMKKNSRSKFECIMNGKQIDLHGVVNFVMGH
jgi:hypothetical protein